MRGRLGVLTWGVALFLTLPCSLLAQGIQTPSETLETVLSLVQDNPYVSAKHAQVLSAFLATAVDQAAITPDEALKLFEAVGWTELTSEDAVGFAVRALELALIAVTAEGTPCDEVLAKLSEMAESGELGPLASETSSANALPGLATALLHSTENLTPELLAEIEGAVVSGVPPGQVIRTVRRKPRPPWMTYRRRFPRAPPLGKPWDKATAKTKSKMKSKQRLAPPTTESQATKKKYDADLRLTAGSPKTRRTKATAKEGERRASSWSICRPSNGGLKRAAIFLGERCVPGTILPRRKR